MFLLEFEFKPVLNPPPEFFELRPVTNSLFPKLPKEPEVETSTAFPTSTTRHEMTSSIPEYSVEDYNNFTEAPETLNSYEEPEEQEQDQQQTENVYQEHPALPIDARHKRKLRKPVNTGIFTAFQKMTGVFDNFFANG